MKSIKEIRRDNLRMVVAKTGGPGGFLTAYAHNYGDEDDNLSPAYLSQITAKSSNIGDATARRLEKAMGKPENWMDTDHTSLSGDNVHQYASKPLPVISWVQAGNWSEAIDNFHPGDAEDWLPCPYRHGPNAFILRVHGDSMYNPGGERSYKHGDFIAVDPSKDAIHGSMVVVRMDSENTATFKQLLIEPNGTMMLKALNPEWPEKIIRVNGSATICGVVIGRWDDE